MPDALYQQVTASEGGIMRGIVFSAACGFLYLLLPIVLYAEQAPAPDTAAALPAPVAGPLSGQRADVLPEGSRANRWRYSFHNGHWWYYRDGGRWAYWTGADWRDYESKSYQRWYVERKMADLDRQLARFDARWMQPYMSESFTDGYSGWATYGYRGLTPAYGLTSPRATMSPWSGSGGVSSGMFTPRGYDGRLDPATSIGGYMGGALRGPFGY
jgi:hypothetical protein